MSSDRALTPDPYSGIPPRSPNGKSTTIEPEKSAAIGRPVGVGGADRRRADTEQRGVARTRAARPQRPPPRCRRPAWRGSAAIRPRRTGQQRRSDQPGWPAGPPRGTRIAAGSASARCRASPASTRTPCQACSTARTAAAATTARHPAPARAAHHPRGQQPRGAPPPGTSARQRQDAEPSGSSACPGGRSTCSVGASRQGPRGHPLDGPEQRSGPGGSAWRYASQDGSALRRRGAPARPGGKLRAPHQDGSGPRPPRSP